MNDTSSVTGGIWFISVLEHAEILAQEGRVVADFAFHRTDLLPILSVDIG